MEKFNDAQIVELIVSQITIYTISIILESQVATVWILEQKVEIIKSITKACIIFIGL